MMVTLKSLPCRSKNSKAVWQAVEPQPPAGSAFMTAAEAESVYKARQADYLANQQARASRPRQQQVQAQDGRNKGPAAKVPCHSDTSTG
jgi:hypothetical protein